MKTFYLKQIAFLFFAILSVSDVWGQTTTFSWNFTNANGSVATTTPATGNNITPSVVSSNTTGSGIGINGTSVSSGYAGASGGNNDAAIANPGTSNIYYSITLTPASGDGINLTNVNFGSRSTSTGPQAYSIKTSVDNFVAVAASGTLANNSAWALHSNSLSVTGAANTAIEIRIFASAGAGNTSTSPNWRIDDLSITATATSSGTAPVIGTNPSDVSVCSGSAASFTVAASGTPTPTYQWQRSATGTGGTFTDINSTTDGGIYTNYTTVTLNIATPPTAINGYAYQAVATNSASSATSTAATITVNANTWQGGTGDWNTAGNWSCGIPTAITDVLIPSGNPTITLTTDNAASLHIAPGASLSVNTGSILNIGGAVVDSGIINGNGQVVLNGTAAQIVTGIGTMSNLQVSNAAGVSIAVGDTVYITNALTMTAGILTTNGGLVLTSNLSGTAAIAPITGGSIAGNVRVQQYMGGKRAFRFLGHPFSTAIPLSQLENNIDVTGAGGNTNGFTPTLSNNSSAFWYNPATGNGSTQNDSTGWIPFMSANGSGNDAWKPGEGIRVLVRGAQGQGLDGSSYTPNTVTLNMNGPVNQGPVNMPMHVGAHSGYNLFSNPYPSPTDIGTVINNAAVNMNGVGFYVWNTNMQGSGAYETEIIGNVYYLPANASFVVDAATDGSTLAFAESNKGTAANEGLLKATMLCNSIMLHIYDTAFNPWDRLYLSFNANAADSVEKNDAKKMHNSNLDFYSLSSNGQELAVDARPYTNGQVIPLGIATNMQQTYIIKTEDLLLPAGIQVYLRDKYLNETQLLQEGAQYAFTITSDAASQGNNRFELNTIGTVSTSVANVNSNDLKVNIMPNPAIEQVTVTYQAGASAKTSVKVVNMLGQEVINMELGEQQGGSVNIPLHNVAAGMYLVKLTSGTETIIQKLIKQ